MIVDCKGYPLDLAQAKIMAVVNVTPDSFSDGGQFSETEFAIAHGNGLLLDGAEVIDVGGESSRPGAEPVPIEVEIDRVVPVISGIRAQSRHPISIDSCKPEVMRAAIEAGASMINDIFALQKPGALEVAASYNVPICLMHMQGEPQSMQAEPRYDDVVEEVYRFLAERIEVCIKAGIGENRLMIDPGFGFGKTLKHNLSLLKNLSRFKKLGRPLLVGLSRKSMLAALIHKPVTQRTTGSVVLAALAVQNGADIVRVHDVPPTVEMIKILRAVALAE